MTKYVAEIPKGKSKPDDVWSYEGLNAYYFKLAGDLAEFKFFGNGTFRLIFPYDDGPILQTGRCERISPK